MRTKYKKATNQIAGKWTDGISVFEAIQQGPDFNAHILSTSDTIVKPGELKAIFNAKKNGYDTRFYSYKYAPRYLKSALYKEGTLLYIGGGAYWSKIDSPFVREMGMTNTKNISLPVIQRLDDKNVLFSIPSFSVESQGFNKYILDHIDLLLKAENLIFDIRGNTGGNALYMSFIDIYADRPLPSSQGLVLASEDTKQYFEKQAKFSPPLFQPVVDAILTGMGKIVYGPAYPEKRFEKIESTIKNVAILTDNGCMSAAESFVLHSKAASSKVKVFGSPTAGSIDYTSVNVLLLNSGNQNIYFGYPTSTLHTRIPEDGFNSTGILPDVPIKVTVHDKVKFIVDYYNQK